MRVVYTFLHFSLGIFIMLLGMLLVHANGQGLWTSYVNVVFMLLGVYYIVHALGLRKFIFRKHLCFFLLGLFSITITSIWFSSHYLFLDELGNTEMISPHWEHSWCYNSIREIAETIKAGEDLSETLDYLHLRQYRMTFIYSSLMFIFGGNEPTNICIWNGMHLGLIAILACLIALRLDITDKKRLGFILVLVLFQPFFDALHIYHRDIVGEAIMLAGMYIFVSVYKKPLYSLLLLPIYGFLFYCFRYQYAIVAVFLCLWFLVFGRQSRSDYIYFIWFLVFFVVIWLFNALDVFEFIDEDLNYQSYSGNVLEKGGGFFRTVLVGLIGYFPWTNLVNDDLWAYHIVMPLQAMMNVSILYTLFYYNRNMKVIVESPAIMSGLLFFMMAFGGGVGHVSYFSVGMPLLLLGINRNYSSVIKAYSVLILVFFVIGYLYRPI